MVEKLEVGAIFSRLGELLRENAGSVLGCVGGLVLLNIGLDLVTKGNEATFLSGIASLIAQYYVTGTALERRGIRKSGGRIGGFWGVNILTGLGILLGYIFLVLPGIYLSARWVAASACLLGDDTSVSNAIGKSWEMTRSSVWAIIGTLLVIFVPPCVVGLGLGVLVGLGGDAVSGSGALGSAITYVFLFSAFAVSWLAGVAIYSLMHTDHDIADVFA